MGIGNAAPITVALVEDDDEARRRLVASITAHPALRLSGEWSTGAAALAGLAQGAPDVLLVDLGLPDMPGLRIVRLVAERHPDCDILVVTIFGDEQTVITALEAGARGYLLKGALQRDIAVDIQDLRNGGSPLSPVIARQVLKRMQLPLQHPGAAQTAADAGVSLTAREAEILNAIARGFSYQETAALLGISVLTVHTHLKRIYRKLAVHSKTEAVFEADKRGLL
jgi:DNA-binding NarL/FixJ family response regulator